MRNNVYANVDCTRWSIYVFEALFRSYIKRDSPSEIVRRYIMITFEMYKITFP